MTRCCGATTCCAGASSACSRGSRCSPAAGRSRPPTACAVAISRSARATGCSRSPRRTSSCPKPTARFGMLETIRELAGERLAAGGEEPAIRGAHARWYLALAEEGGPNRRGAERAAWLDRVGRERENLRAALAWSGAGGDVETGLRLAAGLAPFWIAHGLDRRGQALPRGGPRRLARAEPRTRAGARGRRGSPDAGGGRRAVRARLPREPDAARRAARSGTAPSALNVLGTAARYRGRAGRRRDDLYDEALALATTADLWWPAALVQANLGALAGLEGRHAEAVRTPRAGRRDRARGRRRLDGRRLLDERGARRPATGRPRSRERPAGRGASQLRRRSRTPGASPSAWTRSPPWPGIAGTTSGRPASTAPRRRSGSGPGSRCGPRSAPSTRPAWRRRRPRSAGPPGRVRGREGRALSRGRGDRGGDLAAFRVEAG